MFSRKLDSWFYKTCGKTTSSQLLFTFSRSVITFILHKLNPMKNDGDFGRGKNIRGRFDVCGLGIILFILLLFIKIQFHVGTKTYSCYIYIYMQFDIVKTFCKKEEPKHNYKNA